MSSPWQVEFMKANKYGILFHKKFAKTSHEKGLKTKKKPVFTGFS